MAATEDDVAKTKGFGVLTGDRWERMPNLVNRVKCIPSDPTIFISFHDIDPFFCKFEVLAEGVKVIASQEAVPTLAD